MEALFIGHSYIDVTVQTGGMPSGDEKAVDQADSRPEPCAVPNQLTSVHRVRLVRHRVTTTVACMNGWIEQT